MNEYILKSFIKLKNYCDKEQYQGWDPYDGLNSKLFNKIPLISRKRIVRLAWIQFIKKMPVNLRPILLIKKGINSKGIALFLSGYAKLSEISSFNNESVQKIEVLSEKLLTQRIAGYSGGCWGYNFDWESRAFFKKKNSPTIVATTFAANALLDAYDATKNKSYLDAAIDSKHFILNDLKRTVNKNGDFAFSYSPTDDTVVFNASLLGARLLSRIYTYTNEPSLIADAKKVMAFCCSYQNLNGSWYYSTLPFHQWIDNFHTGFNLECIYEYGIFSKDNTYRGHFDKGLNYYLNTFFDKKGRSKYYNNAVYPIDIHAPAQLIITMSKSNLLSANIQTVNTVLNWTINNMQSTAGFFYYQIKKFYANKIPYMRWSQAWMFYGLAHYLREIDKLDNGTGKVKPII